MDWRYLSLALILYIVGTAKTSSIENVSCSRPELERCLHNIIDDVFSSTPSRDCSNVTDHVACVHNIQRQCVHHYSQATSNMLDPYFNLIQNFNELYCDPDLTVTYCDVSEAVSCIKDVFSSLTSASVGPICRQTIPALQCLSPVKAKCSGVHRYAIALITDELQLTSDLWCSHKTCKLDIADQCMHEAKRAIAYPISMVPGSNLVCSDVRHSLTCMSNHTDFCDPAEVPTHISDGFMQLLRFATSYCNSADLSTPYEIDVHLSPLTFLAKISTNRWTPVADICKMFNETIKMSALDKQVSTSSDLEHLFTWQNVLRLNVDKYTDLCFPHQTWTCDWITRLANENPVCDLFKARNCLDKVLLSKLVVDVYIARNTWENVCGVAYNMLACAQFYTESCIINDASTILDVSQEIENIVGYECSQLGLSGNTDTCRLNKRLCHISKAIEECSNITDVSNVCRFKDDVVSCFNDNTHQCNSVEASIAQFYMEQLLHDCTLNTSLVNDDMYRRIADCKLQFGYNMNNGIQMYNEWTPVMCTAYTYYQQCLSLQTLPGQLMAFMQDAEKLISNQLQRTCNISNNGLVRSGTEESENCDLKSISGEVALYINLFHSFPFMSMIEQENICRSYPDTGPTWTVMINPCSNTRRNILNEAINYLDELSASLCHVTTQAAPKSCDINTVYTCFEDFGTTAYFVDLNVDVCEKLEDTYKCLHDNAMGCSDETHNDMLQEVIVIHGILGNTTCPRSSVCGGNLTSSTVPWLNEICSDWEKCSVFGWLSCVEQYNIAVSCQFYTEVISCIENSLSGCDPLQHLFARSEMKEWSQQNLPFCTFIPIDPPSVTALHRTMFQCSSFISFSTDVTKAGICSSIDKYLNCLATIEQQDVPYTWRGILGSNIFLWQKHVYVDCRMSDMNEFIVDTDINLNEVTNTACGLMSSQLCLRAYTNLAVTYFYLVPLSERQSSICERSDLFHQCVINQTTGCTDSLQRTMLSSVVWVGDTLNNVGTCTTDVVMYRECDVSGAMTCITQLGHILLEDLTTPSLDTICSQDLLIFILFYTRRKLHTTSICVNERTSSCNYLTRSEVSETFNQVATLVKRVCRPTQSSSSVTSCMVDGETAMCDVEAALLCMVPIQALMMQPNSTLQQVCGSIPEMQSCIHRTTSGCDDMTITMISDRVHRLSHRLNDRCPEIYCDQCLARQCLITLHANMRYENVDTCGLVTETKQCIQRYAGYCSPIVSETLLREIPVLVGDEAYLCEITLQACLQTFMTSAYQIVGYIPTRNLSIQEDFILQQLCNEVSSAYYCIGQQMTSLVPERLQVMNSTLHTIGDFVYNKCNPVTSLRCYSCSNSTSYEECNQQGTQTCPADKQMCVTYITGDSIRKGCTEVDLCENGCTGLLCTMCCGTSLCNQPMNSIITDSPTCQTETAIYCAFQLMFTLIQNDTVNCMRLQESVSCMIQSTEGCMLPGSVKLGTQARDLIYSDVMLHCTSNSPTCTCGECSSMLLLSITASPFGEQETFCRNVFDMYNQSMMEMDLNNCSIASLQMTANNLQLASYMVQGICAMYGVDTTDCVVNGVTYTHGTSYKSLDGCNTCTCNMGDEVCTLMYCPPADSQCPELVEGQVGTCVQTCLSNLDCSQRELCCSNGCGHVCMESIPKTNITVKDCIYEDMVYKSGESFLATDGCNHCFCHDSMIGCTQMYCPYPDNRDCDIVGVQDCMNIASLAYLVTMTTPNNTQHVCISAANMLKCIESKISSCPPDVVDVIHSATWWQLDTIHTLCDMNTIIWTYLQPNNTTSPENKGTCSIHSALQCIQQTQTDQTCSSYLQVIDCVKGNTIGCLSVDMVAVLYELSHYLESSVIECNYNIPELQVDFLYPIAECMQNFALAMSEETTMNNLIHGNFAEICDSIQVFMYCLDDIYNVQPVVKMLAENIVSTISNMLSVCHNLNTYTDTSVECYTCEGTSCTDQSVIQCDHNQVCATSVQLDVMTGRTYLTKGCADVQWCYNNHGCNPTTVMCANCCLGNKCNLESNVTIQTTVPTTVKPLTTTLLPWTTTQIPQTTTRLPWATTWLPQTTTIPSTCDISYTVTSLMMKTLNLLNFNLLSIMDRRSLCMNYDVSMNQDFYQSCPTEIISHIEMLYEKMKFIAIDVCSMFNEQQENEEKCSQVIQCVMNIGNFSDKHSSCRSIASAKQCLKWHYEYCEVTGQMSINNTLKLLSNMDFVICEPNKLLEGPDVDCVAMTMNNSSEGSCNVTMAMECGSLIQKAMHNPFLQQTEYCRLVKRGMLCIRDNTYHCHPGILQNMSHYVNELVQTFGNICPNVWCPSEDICSLETAWNCLNTLDAELTSMTHTGNWSTNICKSLTQTHSCILNNTDECYTADRQRLIQNFNMITAVVDTFCKDDSSHLQQCLHIFHQRLDELLNFDTFHAAEVLKHSLRISLKRYILSEQYKHGDSTTDESMSDTGDEISMNNFELPETFSFLLKNNQLEGIDITSFLQFLLEVMQEEQSYSEDSSGYGEDSSGYGEDSSGYGLNLPGAYSFDSSNNAEQPDIHNNVKKITNILFGQNKDDNLSSYRRVTDEIKVILNLSDIDVANMINTHELSVYMSHKLQHCNAVKDAMFCVENSILLDSTFEQKYILRTTLSLLNAMISEHCQVSEAVCHSCIGLHSNEECNTQPQVQCGPLDVCHAKIVDSHFYKGCLSKLTCEETCEHTDGPCYCCHGYQCNKYQPRDYNDDREECSVLTAVDVTMDLLMFAVNYTECDTYILNKSTIMSKSTAGCYGDNLQLFYTEGRRLMKYIGAKHCRVNYTPDACDIKSMTSLTSLVSSPYHTIDTIDTMCRLLEHTVQEVYNTNMIQSDCCPVVKSLLTIYQQIHRLCNITDIVYIQWLCNIESDLCVLDDVIHGNMSANDTGSTKFLHAADEGYFCHVLNNHMESNNNFTSDLQQIIPACNIQMTMTCYNEDLECSEESLDKLLECVDNVTKGCSVVQMVPVLIETQRIVYSCNRTEKTIHIMRGTSPFECLENLSSLPSQPDHFLSRVCDTILETIHCIQSSKFTIDHLQMFYIKHVQTNLMTFNEHVCMKDDYEGMDLEYNTCDVTQYTEDIFHHLISTLTSGFIHVDQSCWMMDELNFIQENISSCIAGRNMLPVLSWIQENNAVMCSSNLAMSLCQNNVCDLVKAEELMDSLGYFLGIGLIDGNILCRKVDNIMQGLKCALQNCDEKNISGIHEGVDYIKSIVGKSCPSLSDDQHCDSIKTDLNKLSNKENVSEVLCGIKQAEMCIFNVSIPSNLDPLFCSKMMTAVKELSECVHSHLTGCHDNQWMEIKAYYRDVFANIGYTCDVDFNMKLFNDVCVDIPECSQVDAWDCISYLNKSTSCGNLEDVKQCIQYTTEGCNSIQMFAVMTSLHTNLMLQKFPSSCWEDLLIAVDNATGVEHCVLTFKQELFQHNSSDDVSCDVMMSLMTCLYDELRSDNVPDVITNTLIHAINDMRHPLQMVCSMKGTQSNGVKDTGAYNGTCSLETARHCLTSYAANVFLMPAFSQDARRAICNNLSHGMSCIRQAVEDCKVDEVEHVYDMMRTLETLTQLSGTCAIKHVTCSPDLSTQCISELSQALSSPVMNPYTVCLTLDATDICMKQTLHGCNNALKNLIMNILEPIRCKALSMCPMNIDVHSNMTDQLPTCVDPSEMVIHDGTCQPSVALKCLQDSYLSQIDPFNKHQICSDYLENMACFFNNINTCEDDTVVKLAMYHAAQTRRRYESVCDITITYGCDSLQSERCDLQQVDICIHDFLKHDEPKETCLYKKMLKHCFKFHTDMCPRMIKQYTEMKIHVMLEASDHLDYQNCDYIGQCIHDYTTIYDRTLQLTHSYMSTRDQTKGGNVDIPDIQVRTMFLCESRLDTSSCMKSNLQSMLPDGDHILHTLFYGLDNMLVDACSVLVGLQPDIPYCNITCIECLIEQSDYVRLLQTLVVLEDMAVNESDAFQMESTTTFCKEYDVLTTDNMTSCSTDIMTCGWHNTLVEGLQDLHALYCTEVCNTTTADICILTLENDISALTGEELCLSYNDTLECIYDSLTMCDVQIMVEYVSVAGEMFNNSGVICYTIPTLEVGYETSHMVLHEGEGSQNITVTLMSAMSDVCKGTSCYLLVFITSEDTSLASCSTGDDIPGILMTSCSHTFTSDSVVTDSYMVQMFARSDLRSTLSHNATFHVIAQLWIDNEFAMENLLATVTMEIVNRDSKSPCYIISEPYIRTFDGLDYYNFNQGEYVLYQHDSLPEKVHIGFQRCARGKQSVCPCAVLIQVEDDVYIIDTCRRIGETVHALEFKVYQYSDLSEEIIVYSTNERKSYDFVLPSGAIVYVRTFRYMLDVWIKSSARDWGHTSGLCGTMDGDKDNDLTRPDGTVMDIDDVRVWRRVLLPDQFVNSWKTEESLFGGVPVDISEEESVTLPECVCMNSTCTITSRTETCGFTSGTDITDQLDIYKQQTNNPSRKKRQTNEIWDTIDIDEIDTTLLPTWPTVNGWTEEIAAQACEEGLKDHELWDTCSYAINTTDIVSSCITDILLTGSEAAVQNAVENMKRECKMAVLSYPNIADILNTTTDQLVLYVNSLTCLNDCTNHGQCINDLCLCDQDFYGEDCSMPVTMAPAIYSTSQSLFTPTVSTSSSTESATVMVYGEAFISSDSLTCHVTAQQGQSTTSMAQFLTSGTILCDVTGTFPYSSIQLSTSNDGVNQSNSISMIFYDPVCYQCDQTASNCTIQPTSCVINDVCYSPGDFNPNDSCQLCDPISNEWKFKPSSSCSTTTSSSSSITTSLPTSKASSTSISSSSSSQSPSSTTESSTASTKSSSTISSVSPFSSISSSPTSRSSTESVNGSDGQDGEKAEDTKTLTIIIIVAAGVGGLLILAVIGFALRLRKKDSQKGSVLGSTSMPTTSSDVPKGQINPVYADGERRGQIIQQERIIPGYSASFDPRGLGEPAVRAVYREPYGSPDVNVAMFSDRNNDSIPAVSRQVGDVVVEAPYRIPRPVTSSVPHESRPDPSSRQAEQEYDNAKRVAERKVKISSMPDFYENDDTESDSSSTRL